MGTEVGRRSRSEAGEDEESGCCDKCKICMQTFMCTAKEVVLRNHVEQKHTSKKTSFTFEQCFPTFGQTKVVSAAKQEKSDKKAAKAKEIAGMKKADLKAMAKKNKKKKYKGSA